MISRNGGEELKKEYEGPATLENWSPKREVKQHKIKGQRAGREKKMIQVIKDKNGKIIDWAKDNRCFTIITFDHGKTLDKIVCYNEIIYITKAFHDKGTLFPITEFDIEIKGEEITLKDYERYNPLTM